MRKAFFSFKYSDAWRVHNVMNSQVVGVDAKGRGFLAPQEWETLKRQGDSAIAQWINEQMRGTSVTVVLVGEKTADSRWVRYEIEKTLANKKGLLAIHIHKTKDSKRNFSKKGQNPLAGHYVNVEEFFSFGPRKKKVTDFYNTYDWMGGDGRDNIGDWIEEANQLSQKIR